MDTGHSNEVIYFISNFNVLTALIGRQVRSAIFVNDFSINPLRAKFFRGNINIDLHFMSLLHIEMTQVLKILPQVRPGPTHST